MFTCPKSGLTLIKMDGRYTCPSGHSYDIASQGYVNLLLGNKKNAFHGDNKLMLASRRAFLSLGYYYIIIQKISDIIKSRLKEKHVTVIDAGCGEGYYTNGIMLRLTELGYEADFYGIDVSKDAAAMAAKAYKGISFAVASVNEMPFSDNCADALISVFAPISEKEFYRVLKPGGILITVSPSPRHLFGLKEKIYDVPYENPLSTFSPQLLKKVGEDVLTYEAVLENQKQINSLFTMTPYFYKTDEAGHRRVSQLTEVKTEIGFVFGIFLK